MTAVSVIIHERVANWSRQLRPRFQGWPIHWSESRSTDSLVKGASASACPILVIDLDRQAAQGLLDLDEALQVAPHALSVLLDPLDREEVASLAREVGATLVLTGQVVPPEVEKLLQRWIPMAQQRIESQGWSASSEPEPELWEDPDLFATQAQADPLVAPSD